MTWLPRLSTRTALFADAVDRGRARNWSVPSRPLDDDTAALVRLAEDLQRLREHSLVVPAAPFVANLRAQLMEVAPSAIVVIPPEQRRPSHTPLPGVPPHARASALRARPSPSPQAASRSSSRASPRCPAIPCTPPSALSSTSRSQRRVRKLTVAASCLTRPVLA